MSKWIRITGENAHMIQVGDRLKEIDEFGAALLTATTAAECVHQGSTVAGNVVQWHWMAVGASDTPVNYLITAGLEHYGPEVYVEREVNENS